MLKYKKSTKYKHAIITPVAVHVDLILQHNIRVIPKGSSASHSKQFSLNSWIHAEKLMVLI